ncbi:glycosyltransferase family 1 protein [Denitratimonas sp. CY0512]|uniref:glycosyltransferase family 4 protein n=1 Tax=Denitratimonas sp. CY0512 TaxID=3131940 RepID=UPI0030B73BBC
MNVTHYMRQPRSNVFSIERLYDDVREALPGDIHANVWICREPSSGLLPRLRDAWAARKVQADVNHVTGDTHYLTYFLNRQRTLLTVHDLVALDRSRGLKRFLLWLFWYWLPIKRSRLVVTISVKTKQSLLSAVRCDPGKVVVIHNPVSDEFRPLPKAFNVTHPRILQIGTKPNKNLERVAEALAGLPCTLVIVGKLTAQQEAVLAQHRVTIENHVGLSRGELLSQYEQADLLMFASLYEGFGLPIVEANAVGRPVITSSLSPMPEVAGDAALFVDPFDVQSIRQSVIALMRDAALRDRLVAAGFHNAKRFSSRRVAEHYASIYRSIAS